MVDRRSRALGQPQRSARKALTLGSTGQAHPVSASEWPLGSQQGR